MRERAVFRAAAGFPDPARDPCKLFTILYWKKEDAMEYFDLLNIRTSSHRFTDVPVSKEDLDRILQAGNHAPIGSNRYRDLHLTIVQDRQVLDRLAEAALVRRSNTREMAEIINTVSNAAEILEQSNRYDPFYHAPAVIFVSHKEQDLEPHIEWCNVTTVTMAMHLAATDLGLGSCFMWFALDSMRRIPELDHTDLLKLPQGFKPLLGLAVGHIEAPLKERAIDPARITAEWI